MSLWSIFALSKIQRPVSRKHILIFFISLACLGLPLSANAALRRPPGVRSIRPVQHQNGESAVYHVFLDWRFKVYELDTLARQIKRAAPKIHEMSILYFLRGMKPDQKAWATCRFNPSLDAFEIEIDESATATNPPDKDLQQ